MAAKKRSVYVLPEPNWDILSKLTLEEDRLQAFYDCTYFAHYEISDVTGVTALKKWFKKNWSAEDMKHISKVSDSTFMSLGKYGFVWSKLGYLPKSHIEYLNKQRECWVLLGKEENLEEVVVKTKVVVERQNLPKFLDTVYDSIATIISGNSVNVDSLVTGQNLTGPEQSKAYVEIDKTITEFNDLLIARKLTEKTDWDEQLIEAYEHIKTPILKKLIESLEGIQTALTQNKIIKKITKIRKKKPTDKNKLVRRLKFQTECLDLNIKSESAVDIIGASEVWLYDTKRKKLCVYASDYANTLGVKGTGIDNYSTTKSYEMALRKPEQQLPEFMKLRKNGLNKFMLTIKGKKLPVKKRIQATMVILRVVS
jgi:hypothetical protein